MINKVFSVSFAMNSGRYRQATLSKGAPWLMTGFELVLADTGFETHYYSHSASTLCIINTHHSALYNKHNKSLNSVLI